VRHGKWIVTKEFNDVLDMDVEKYTCSACGEYRLTASGLSQATNYCPNCGAKMDADE
jgi:transposase